MLLTTVTSTPQQLQAEKLMQGFADLFETLGDSRW